MREVEVEMEGYVEVGWGGSEGWGGKRLYDLEVGRV